MNGSEQLCHYCKFVYITDVHRSVGAAYEGIPCQAWRSDRLAADPDRAAAAD